MQKLENIECLIDGDGQISIGRYGSIRCAAVACDEAGQLAALVKHQGESLDMLLQRLDKAIDMAWEDEIFTDEINH